MERDELFQVLHEDSGLLVIRKPAGLVVHPTKTDEYSSLISRVRLYLGGQCQPQLINRLDRETSGVTLVALDLESARKLRRLWENRQVQKEYLAIVHGHLRQEEGLVDAPLGKDESSRVAIKDCVRPDGVVAETRFKVLKRFKARGANRSASTADLYSLVQVFPRTGRKHQIRIHLAHLGHPIVGDKLYGLDEDFYLALVEDRLTEVDRAKLILPYHALHASRVTFEWRGQEKRFEAAPERWFQDFAGSS